MSSLLGVLAPFLCPLCVEASSGWLPTSNNGCSNSRPLHALTPFQSTWAGVCLSIPQRSEVHSDWMGLDHMTLLPSSTRRWEALIGSSAPPLNQGRGDPSLKAQGPQTETWASGKRGMDATEATVNTYYKSQGGFCQLFKRLGRQRFCNLKDKKVVET